MKFSAFKPILIILLSMLGLAFSINVHAGFRKALDAYIARDGEVMLKEVKDAVDKKNNDGLMLFLYSMDLDAYSSEYDFDNGGWKSGLKTMLSKNQWDGLRELLTQATNNSSVDLQYYLRRGLFADDFRRQILSANLHQIESNKKLSNEQFSEAYNKVATEYASKGSKLAILDASILVLPELDKKADAGDVDIQLMLGLMYMHDTNSQYGCKYVKPTYKICDLPTDELKGYYWLKRAAQSYETKSNFNSPQFANEMCEFFRNTAKGDKAKLRQAFLWAQMAVNESANFYANQCLDEMQQAGDLKLVAPKLSDAWSDFNTRSKILYKPDLEEFPDWIIEIRQELAKKDMPVFEYAGLEIYKDGRVLYGFARTPYRDELMKVPTKTVQKFLSELKKTGFYEWTPKDFNRGICGDMGDCSELNTWFTARKSTKVKRLFFFLHNPSRKFGRIDQQKDWLDIQRMATIKVLVDKYFPTQQLRCGLGGSEERKKECLDFDNQWLTVADWAKAKPVKPK
jgi:hypothetical protein